MRRNTHPEQAGEATHAASRTAALVRRANEGDSDALACLIGQHDRSLNRFCRRLVGAGDAEDLVQETLLRAVQAIAHLKDPDRFAAWLFGIASNLARKWWERRARWPLSLEDLASAYPDVPWHAALSLDPAEAPDVLAEHAEHVARLGEAVRALPVSLRRVVQLHYLDGLSYAEIAAALDVPLSTVRGRLFTSRTRLQRALAAEDVRPETHSPRAARTHRLPPAAHGPHPTTGAERPRVPNVPKGGPEPMAHPTTTAPAAPRLLPVVIDSVRIYDPEWPDHFTPATANEVIWAFNPISKPLDQGSLRMEEVRQVAARIAVLLDEAHLRIGHDLRVALLKTAPGAAPGMFRSLPVVIGFPEAAAIVMQQRDLEPPRPLTHDLLCQVLAELRVRVARVVIVDDGEYTMTYRSRTYQLPLFRATLVLKSSRREVVLDARASDALAIAVRTSAPVFAEASTLERYGFVAEDDPAKMAPFVSRMSGGFQWPPVGS